MAILVSFQSLDSWLGGHFKFKEAFEVLEELQRKDLFVYLGHGERARQLLGQLQAPKAPQLRSILVLLGCSSVKIEGEEFGMASAALLGGAPLVLGAQWDVLGGDLDKLASRRSALACPFLSLRKLESL